jgi:hypothetical protein
MFKRLPFRQEYHAARLKKFKAEIIGTGGYVYYIHASIVKVRGING